MVLPVKNTGRYFGRNIDGESGTLETRCIAWISRRRMNQPHAIMESLPEPDAQAMERSRALVALIGTEIRDAEQSMISFQRFMELALYAPGLGYYQSETLEFGGAGDFITAPEISSLFSRCVARQVAQVLAKLQGGDILEVGAGSGIMAADIVQALWEASPKGQSLPGKYLILERSAALRRLQHATIEARAPSFLERFRWLSDLPGPGFEGVILANELLDAMPVRRFFIEDGAVWEWMVSWAEDALVWRLAPSRPGLEQAVAWIANGLGGALPDEYTSEVHPAQAGWLREVARRMDAGLILLFDYGYPHTEYYHPERSSGTLTCHYRHRLHDDPFFLPGLQDISVHVNFSAIAEAGVAEDLELAGFTTQRDFLFATGLPEMCAQVDPLSPGYLPLAQKIKYLTLPGEMGDIVKVIGLTRGIDEDLEGFTGLDLRGRL
uniref:SAM-dependent methyltransferase, MidA family n=1 Tax=Candidatus Kentrum sp. LFY TaxID=2126342 RepID=A0A450UKQ6_9GAMM|nr:MAG: SAM-dependent methyltransferase, MidA family [Candidatus Kentron sp. LFY]